MHGLFPEVGVDLIEDRGDPLRDLRSTWQPSKLLLSEGELRRITRAALDTSANQGPHRDTAVDGAELQQLEELLPLESEWRWRQRQGCFAL